MFLTSLLPMTGQANQIDSTWCSPLRVRIIYLYIYHVYNVRQRIVSLKKNNCGKYIFQACFQDWCCTPCPLPDWTATPPASSQNPSATFASASSPGDRKLNNDPLQGICYSNSAGSRGSTSGVVVEPSNRRPPTGSPIHGGQATVVGERPADSTNRGFDPTTTSTVLADNKTRRDKTQRAKIAVWTVVPLILLVLLGLLIRCLIRRRYCISTPRQFDKMDDENEEPPSTSPSENGDDCGAASARSLVEIGLDKP
jgi:hypothetical protein